MDRRDFDEFRRRVQEFPLKRVLTIAGLVLIGAVVLAAPMTMFYTVQPDEEAVVLRFGKFIEPIQPPGLHWKLPFGIDRAYLVATQKVHKLEFGFRSEPGEGEAPRRARARFGYEDESHMLTGNLDIADVKWVVQFQILNPKDYLFHVRNPEATLRDVSESAMRLVIGDISFTEARSGEGAALEAQVQEKIQAILDRYGAGIQIITVKLQGVFPPSQTVKDAFDDVSRATQEQKDSENQANRDYEKSITEAEGAAEKMLAEAEGYKLKRINEAMGDVEKFKALVAEYKKAKEVTRARLYLEALADVLPRVNHIYVMDEGQTSPLQVLDLKAAAAATRRKER